MTVIFIFLENPVKQIDAQTLPIWLPIPLLARSLFRPLDHRPNSLMWLELKLIIVFNRIELIEKQVNPGGFRLGSKRSLD